ncbi:MAG: TMEM165/GDT1 family protein [Dechloromonas sp.]|nr:TMEM165/GDT1 family protein [Dechloromonas sp.]
MTNLTSVALGNWLSSAGATFLLIALAEFGDKSQLVCMTLAARHRGLPVVLGAVAAFAILNLLAVLFGAAVAAWLPEWVVTLAVAVLFAVFGISALRYQEEDDDEEVEEKPGHGIFATTFLLIFLAEFGDKTQIAVAGMGSTTDTAPVWLGATLALSCTSILGVLAGRKFLHKLPLVWIHRISGLFFLALAAYALFRLL